MPIEVKASMTFQKSFLDGIRYWQKLSGSTHGLLIYGGNESLHNKGIAIESWKHFRYKIKPISHFHKQKPLKPFTLATFTVYTKTIKLAEAYYRKLND